jgi:hypothetical protein
LKRIGSMPEALRPPFLIQVGGTRSVRTVRGSDYWPPLSAFLFARPKDYVALHAMSIAASTKERRASAKL